MSKPPDRTPTLGLPVVNPAEAVPVYDCHILFSGPDPAGRLSGRVTNLPGITATAQSERELLIQLSRQFKATIIEHRNQGQPVPWNRTPVQPGPGERQRWIPVHL